jgi:hypothetical protein
MVPIARRSIPQAGSKLGVSAGTSVSDDAQCSQLTSPDFFFQTENDFDFSPSQVLSAAMKAAGKPIRAQDLSILGKSVQDGHTFGYFGSSGWSDDVFRFLNKHCQRGKRAAGTGSIAGYSEVRILEMVVAVSEYRDLNAGSGVV